MQFSAAQIAMMVNGRVEGDADVQVASFGKIEEAIKGQLTFLANPKYEEHLYTTHASVILINETQELKYTIPATLIRVADAYTAFATLLDKYQQIQHHSFTGIQQPAYIDATAKIGESVFIGAFSYIGVNAVIGDGARIYPNAYIGDNAVVGENAVIHVGVKVYHDCVLGKNVIVHAGTVIGSDGFGFAPQPDGTFKKIPQIGNVIIEDDVEIGSNTTIDRGTIGSTLIKAGAKLDNLLQIAHNVEIGNNSVIAAQAGISGSTKVGNKVMIGGQVGIVGHLIIADGSKINAQSGVSKSITKPNSAVTGSPAFDYTAALRSQALSRKLPDLEKRIIELEQIVKEMKDKIN
ncbi:MAG: UDP-3-O-(3-hydroxymyristoyl)glucosamine N-acyltransferase [Ferruginibacter sp.]